MTKSELRANIRALKKQYSASQLAEMSEAVCRKVLQMDAFQLTDTILLYQPLPGEVDVSPLIDSAYNAGKTVLLPVVAGSGLELRVYRPGAMAVGAYGIMEPTGEVFRGFGSIGLAIVPGMAFDEAGRRLGRGKGYYDRLMPRISGALRVGVCFGFQLTAGIPCEPHDWKMDCVVVG